MSEPRPNSSVCLVPRVWDAAMVNARGCDLHRHASHRRVVAMIEAGEAVWLIQPKIARLTRHGLLPKDRLRDLSSKFGEAFAKAVRRRESWALTMLATIRKQAEHAGTPGDKPSV